MSKTLVGIVTFGNFNFTKLTVESIEKTTKNPITFFIIVGKPNDFETVEWIKSKNMDFDFHSENWGFPASLNDIYDFAWKYNDFDNLIIAGNDIVVYPNAVDSLINKADNSDWEWISSSQFDVKSLINLYPETAQYFSQDGSFKFYKFNEVAPWEIHKDYDKPENVEPNVIKDVHNLCLYKKSVMEKIGYIDVNFYPAYYSDNDYARRGVNAGLKTCALSNSQYFHFWSRTIHQGSGGSTAKFFEQNRRYYKIKWGDDFAREKWLVPFDSKPYHLTSDTVLPASLKIDDRSDESKIIKFWRGY